MQATVLAYPHEDKMSRHAYVPQVRSGFASQQPQVNLDHFMRSAQRSGPTTPGRARPTTPGRQGASRRPPAHAEASSDGRSIPQWKHETKSARIGLSNNVVETNFDVTGVRRQVHQQLSSLHVQMSRAQQMEKVVQMITQYSENRHKKMITNIEDYYENLIRNIEDHRKDCLIRARSNHMHSMIPFSEYANILSKGHKNVYETYSKLLQVANAQDYDVAMNHSKVQRKLEEYHENISATGSALAKLQLSTDLNEFIPHINENVFKDALADLSVRQESPTMIKHVNDLKHYVNDLNSSVHQRFEDIPNVIPGAPKTREVNMEIAEELKPIASRDVPKHITNSLASGSTTTSELSKQQREEIRLTDRRSVADTQRSVLESLHRLNDEQQSPHAKHQEFIGKEHSRPQCVPKLNLGSMNRNRGFV